MKYSYIIIIMALLFSGFSSVAQTETKKVVIIKKSKDDNGKETVEKVKAEGKEADELLKQMKEDGTLEGIDIEFEIENATKGEKRISIAKTEDINIEKTIKDGKESTTYTITTNNGGNKKVMVWNGDGDMPKEMKEKIKKHKMHEIGSKNGEHMIFIADDNQIEENIEVEVEVLNPNKVTLGVIINNDEGVTVEEIVEGSVAEKIGLEAGDKILKIDNNYTFNTDMLLKALSDFDKGDSCTVRYIRDGKEIDVTAKF